jgi:hypothetical protein
MTPSRLILIPFFLLFPRRLTSAERRAISLPVVNGGKGVDGERLSAWCSSLEGLRWDTASKPGASAFLGSEAVARYRAVHGNAILWVAGAR